MSIIQRDKEVADLMRFNRLTLKEDGVAILFRQTSFPSIDLYTVNRSNLTRQEISKLPRIQLF